MYWPGARCKINILFLVLALPGVTRQRAWNRLQIESMLYRLWTINQSVIPAWYKIGCAYPHDRSVFVFASRCVLLFCVSSYRGWRANERWVVKKQTRDHFCHLCRQPEPRSTPVDAENATGGPASTSAFSTIRRCRKRIYFLQSTSTSNYLHASPKLR